MQNMLQLIDESVRTYVRLASVTCGAPKRFEIPHGRVCHVMFHVLHNTSLIVGVGCFKK